MSNNNNESNEKKTLKVGVASPHIKLCDVVYNVKECVVATVNAAAKGVDLIVFPSLPLTGATCRDLIKHSVLQNRAERGLEAFIKATKPLNITSVIGIYDSHYGETLAFIRRGRVLALVPTRPKKGLPLVTMRWAGHIVESIRDGHVVLPFDGVGDVSIMIIGACRDIPFEPADIAIEYSSLPATMGSRRKELEVTRMTNIAIGSAVVYANIGYGESTTDAVYSAHNIIVDHGEVLAEAEPFSDGNFICADVEVGITRLSESDGELYDDDERRPRRDYFLPVNEEERREACLEALEIQARALAARVERSYSKSMVIGVSGGLDSTLALLVCARAADILGMDRKSIVGVTMPCFGTTKRTKSNAEKLCEALGTTLRIVDIKASVTQHLSDIGHDGVTPDVTFENAQARERTQVLMDISNMVGGLVVGTGDLSELALGWATYNGDHMSMYSVNASVPKTVVRRIVEFYSERDRLEGGACWAILDDILATPVSPELLPPKDGEISQCTEALVGPYELHDYFIYMMMMETMSPADIYYEAQRDFEGVYDNKTILGWLRVFVRRFFSQQFKRSCMPDGPKVSCISMSPRNGLFMPSDASAAVWLEELDHIEKEEK